jgi:hypothetical protein
MDVLVISGCSGDKVFDDAPIGCEEIDASDREELVQEHPNYVACAAEMYTGEEHGYVQRAHASLPRHAGATWHIVSAGYGVVDEDDELVAYDCTLRDMESVMDRAMRMGNNQTSLTHDEARRVVGRKMGMPGDLRESFGSGYNLVFIVLSEPYLVAVSEALETIPDGLTVIAFASKGSKEYLGEAYWAPATSEVRAALESDNFRLKGELLERVSDEIDAKGLSKIDNKPEAVLELVPVLRQAARD